MFMVQKRSKDHPRLIYFFLQGEKKRKNLLHQTSSTQILELLIINQSSIQITNTSANEIINCY